eukprot:CAMPEP_0117677518 /NCGR_PEP_ID=MMETSP0804-20121206/16788_1 /TAXON_ID=1074897 /ORGANISM="Tetraselmis astigmatica, Strain CCMP880" /LENGTH=324 /DNA_ID=CAMNT_0005486807 /DNA_START=93 /DNA_END=1067 /DNA_ORIENTATION=+
MAPPLQQSASPELKRKKSISEKLKPGNVSKSFRKSVDKFRTSVDSGLGQSFRKLSSSMSNSSKRLTYNADSESKGATAKGTEQVAVVDEALLPKDPAVSPSSLAPVAVKPEPSVAAKDAPVGTSAEEEAEISKLVSQMVQQAVAAVVSREEQAAAPAPAPAVTPMYDAAVTATKELPAETKPVEEKAVKQPAEEVVEAKVVDAAEPTAASKDSVTPPTPPGEEAKVPEVSEAGASEPAVVSVVEATPRAEAADEEGVAYEAVADAAELARTTSTPPSKRPPIMKVAGVVAAVSVGIFFGVVGPLTKKPTPPPKPPAPVKKGFFF